MNKTFEKRINEILFTRRNSISVDPEKINHNGKYSKSNRILTDVTKRNIASAGYVLSERLEEALLNSTMSEIINVSKQLSELIDKQLGADVEYHPLYPGFPESVKIRPDVELYEDALIYAASGYKVLPFDPVREKRLNDYISDPEAVNEKISPWIKKTLENADTPVPETGKIIDLGDLNDIKKIAVNLMASPVAYTEDDKKDLSFLMKELKGFDMLIPEKIPNKENLTWLAVEYMTIRKSKDNPFLKNIKNPVDLMRFIVVRSGGDPTLTEKVKLAKIPAAEARLYARMFADMKHAERYIYQRRELFKRISETYHFRSVIKNSSEGKRLNKLLDNVYDKTGERSFTSERDALIKKDEFNKLIDLYRKNPGQMGADLINLVRIAEKSPDYEVRLETLKKAFKENAAKMSPLNLLKVEAVLERKTESEPFNVYASNKGLSDAWIMKNSKEPISEDSVKELKEAADVVLKERYSHKRPLGKVYIEEELKDIKIPVQQRTASEKSEGLTYGSKFDIKDDTNVLRAFIWWTNAEKAANVPIDIDLSAAVYDKDFNKTDDISYFNLKNDYAVHSGDIRDGGDPSGKGAAELLDIDLDKMQKKDAAYALFSVRIYNGDTFAETPCKFGWMQDNDTPMSMFDISKAERAITLNTKSNRGLTILLDIENRQVIWIDKSVREARRNAPNNNLTFQSADSVELYRALHNTIPDLYHLIELHTEARGERVADVKDADTIFTLDRIDPSEYPDAKEFLCASDSDKILGDLVSDELSEADKEWFAKEAEKIAEKIKEEDIKVLTGKEEPGSVVSPAATREKDIEER